jgi:hypothetical protein
MYATHVHHLVIESAALQTVQSCFAARVTDAVDNLLAAVLDHAHKAWKVCAFCGVGNFGNWSDVLVEKH